MKGEERLTSFRRRDTLWLLTLALGIGLSGFGCDRSGRARLNPLDPLNPTTGGRPQGLQAIAGHRRVALSWPEFSLDALTGYRLYRQGAGVADTIEVPGVPPPHTFVDQPVADGETYTYRLSARIRGSQDTTLIETPASSPVIVTPGPEVCWVLDDDLSLIVTLSSDARAISKRVTTIFGARHLAVDPSDGGCWTTTRFGGAEFGPVAVRFAADGAQQTQIAGFYFPGAVAADPRDGSVWIADTGAAIQKESSVARFSRTGRLFFQLTGFTEPSGLAVDPRTGDCWIADRGAGRVIKISPDATVRFILTAFAQPSTVTVDPASGDCWGIDAASGQIFHLRADGTRLATISGFSRPAQIASSGLDGACWVVDNQRREVIQLNHDIPDGYHIDQRQDFHTAFQDFGVPFGISIDSVSGNVWISDTGRGEVSKRTPDGRLIQRFAALSVPVAISVDPGPR